MPSNLRLVMQPVVRLLLDTAVSLNNDERFDTARPILVTVVGRMLGLHGPDHADAQEALNALAVCD